MSHPISDVGFYIWLIIKALLIGITAVVCLIWVGWLCTGTLHAAVDPIPIDYTKYINVKADKRILDLLHDIADDDVGCRACRLEEFKTTTTQQRETLRLERLRRLNKVYFSE